MFSALLLLSRGNIKKKRKVEVKTCLTYTALNLKKRTKVFEATHRVDRVQVKKKSKGHG